MSKIYVLFVSVLLCNTVFSQGGLVNVNGSFGDFGQYSMHPLTNSYNINTFNTVENTKGRRYFFDEWVKGTVIDSSGKEIKSDDFFFNFDKVKNSLLVTKDKKEIIEVNKESIREIHFTDKGINYDFVKEEKIIPYKFVEVLVRNDRVGVYKTINTHLVKANYTTNGLTESGNPYDEFVDAPAYYICYKGAWSPVLLKFKSIKTVLKEESKKVNQFYADHLNDEVDENYLKSMATYINQ